MKLHVAEVEEPIAEVFGRSLLHELLVRLQQLRAVDLAQLDVLEHWNMKNVQVIFKF